MADVNLIIAETPIILRTGAPGPSNPLSAIWNAKYIQGIEVSDTPPTDGQGLVYNLAQNKWIITGFGGMVIHNDTAAKQGGATDEYYHLKNSAYGFLSAQDQYLNIDAAPSFNEAMLVGGETVNKIASKTTNNVLESNTVQIENLLLWSEKFDEAVWTAGTGVTVEETAGGGSYTITGPTVPANNTFLKYVSIPDTSGKLVTVRITCKGMGADYIDNTHEPLFGIYLNDGPLTEDTNLFDADGGAAAPWWTRIEDDEFVTITRVANAVATSDVSLDIKNVGLIADMEMIITKVEVYTTLPYAILSAGDSLAYASAWGAGQSYTQLYAEEYQCDFKRISYPGYKLADILTALEAEVSAGNKYPSVFMEGGANDIDADETALSMINQVPDIVAALLALSKNIVWLNVAVAPAWIGDASKLLQVATFNEALEGFLAQYSFITLVDVNSVLDNSAGSPDYTDRDWKHWNKYGDAKVFNLINELVDFPYYADIHKYKKNTNANYPAVDPGPTDGYKRNIDWTLTTEDFKTTGHVEAGRLTINTNSLVVNAPGYEGKIGIGTATPGEALDIVGSAAVMLADIQNNQINGVCAWQVKNNANHRGSLGIAGTTSPLPRVPASGVTLFSTGHGLTSFITDGNVGFSWMTDVTDTHFFQYTEKMSLSALGALAVVASVDTPILTNTFGNLLINASADNDIIVKLGDAVSANKISFTDSADAEIATINSAGQFTTQTIRMDRTPLIETVNTGAGLFVSPSVLSLSGGTVSAIGGTVNLGFAGCDPGSIINALDFTVYGGGSLGDYNNLETRGINISGANSFFGEFFISRAIALNVTPLIGASGFANIKSAAYGIRINDSVVAGSPHLVPQMYHLLIEKPTTGTNNFQAVLNGTGIGSGLWVGGGSGIRIFASSTSLLEIDKAVQLDNDLIFSGEDSGLSFAEIYTHENAVVTELALQDTDYQVTVFSVNGLSNNMTPDHSNDHITVVAAGKCLCAVSISFQANQVNADNFVFHVKLNNGATDMDNLHSDRTTSTLQSFGSASLSGIIDLAANDTVELWVERTTGGGSSRDIVIRNVTLSLAQIGGT